MFVFGNVGDLVVFTDNLKDDMSPAHGKNIVRVALEEYSRLPLNLAFGTGSHGYQGISGGESQTAKYFAELSDGRA